MATTSQDFANSISLMQRSHDTADGGDGWTEHDTHTVLPVQYCTVCTKVKKGYEINYCIFFYEMIIVMYAAVNLILESNSFRTMNSMKNPS